MGRINEVPVGVPIFREAWDDTCVLDGTVPLDDGEIDEAQGVSYESLQDGAVAVPSFMEYVEGE